MTIISKTVFCFSDDKIKAELDPGRPVMYMAQEAKTNVGHAFGIDGNRNSDGKAHVNFGWGGHGHGYYDSGAMTDRSNRSWNREPMIYLKTGAAPQMANTTSSKSSLAIL
jgi:hypothetical protein